MTVDDATTLTGERPQKVLYCLWNDAKNTRWACAYYHVIMCGSEAEAKHKAHSLLRDGREHEYNPRCLHVHLRDHYYQRSGEFVPTVIVHESEHMKGSLFGYFLTRLGLDVNYETHTSNLAGKLNCNFYSIREIDTDLPLDHSHLTSDVELINE